MPLVLSMGGVRGGLIRLYCFFAVVQMFTR